MVGFARMEEMSKNIGELTLLNILENDTANFEGTSLVLFFSGCKHKCEKCHNPQSWSWEQDMPKMSMDDALRIRGLLESGSYDNLVLSGGDPLFHKNRRGIADLLELITLGATGKIRKVLFTGYMMDEILTSEHDTFHNIVRQCDIVVTGRYIDSLNCIRLGVDKKYVGSTNQELWSIERRNATEYDVVPWEPKVNSEKRSLLSSMLPKGY